MRPPMTCTRCAHARYVRMREVIGDNPSMRSFVCVTLLLLFWMPSLAGCRRAPIYREERVQRVVVGESSTIDVDACLKIAGAVAAALFFSWKLITGWLIINLSVIVSVDRKRVGSIELLKIRVDLEKGSTDTVWLTGCQARVRRVEPRDLIQDPSIKCESKGVNFDLADTRRWQIQKDKIVWDVPQTGKHLTLSPGEKARFEFAGIVEAGETYLVESVVTGYRAFWRWRGFQWRATAVSLPVTMSSLSSGGNGAPAPES